LATFATEYRSPSFSGARWRPCLEGQRLHRVVRAPAASATVPRPPPARPPAVSPTTRHPSIMTIPCHSPFARSCAIPPRFPSTLDGAIRDDLTDRPILIVAPMQACGSSWFPTSGANRSSSEYDGQLTVGYSAKDGAPAIYRGHFNVTATKTSMGGDRGPGHVNLARRAHRPVCQVYCSVAGAGIGGIRLRQISWVSAYVCGCYLFSTPATSPSRYPR